MNIFDSLLHTTKIPRFVCVSFRVKRGNITGEDIPRIIHETIANRNVLAQIREGDSVAVAAGSRGINKIDTIVRCVVDELMSCGARPFIIPAMGSHGGATAEGQGRILTGYGITEQEMGVPIKASMETVQIGVTEHGLPVHIDVFASEADWIVPVGRIKPHTDFRGKYESGLLKMLAIGCGKQFGADICHARGFPLMSRNVIEIARVMTKKLRVAFGMGIIEDALHGTYKLVAVPGNRIEDEEPDLLLEAKTLIPGIPFEKIDALFLNEIGKEISGAGMDPNVTGRSGVLGTEKPFIERIAVLDLSEKSHGNAAGIGCADVTTRRFLDKMDFERTYPNGITSHELNSLKIPPVLPDDRSAMRTCLHTAIGIDPQIGARVVWMHNTLCLQSFLISESLIEEAKNNPDLSIVGGSMDIQFDEEGNVKTDLTPCTK